MFHNIKLNKKQRMAKATIEIDDKFTFTWNKITVGSEKSKRNVPAFVKQFFEKNISTRSELLGAAFHDRYVAKYYEGDTRVKKWSPGVKEFKYNANPEIDPFFLIQVEFLFRGGKGGFFYSPNFTKDSEIKVKLIEVVDENDERIQYNCQLTGSLEWDYKSSHFKNHVEKVEEGGICPWDDVSIDVRINFRDNYELKNIFLYNEKGYKLPTQPIELIDNKIVGNPENETNLCFILDIMPNVLTVMTNQVSSTWPDFKTKNIHMKCKYLNF